jgi:hypothetical protein
MVVLLLGISSCCTKVHCSFLFQINFYNFTQPDLDTIIVVKYVKNSNFTAAKDSITARANPNGNCFSLNAGTIMDFYHDYKIKIPGTGQDFTITEVVTEKKGCNKCFPYRPKSDYLEVLASYKLNGQRQSEGIIKIYK